MIERRAKTFGSYHTFNHLQNRDAPEVVADRFHVMKQVNEELDGAIKKIKKAVVALKNNSEKSGILSGIKKSKYFLLKNEENLTEIEKSQLELVKKVAPTLQKMPQMKEEFRQIFESPKDWREGLFSLSDWLKPTFRRCDYLTGSFQKSKPSNFF